MLVHGWKPSQFEECIGFVGYGKWPETGFSIVACQIVISISFCQTPGWNGIKEKKECHASLDFSFQRHQNDQRLVHCCGVKLGITSGVSSSPTPGWNSDLGSNRSPVV